MSRDRNVTFLVALLFALTAANVLWAFVQGGGPQHWDSAIHLTETLAANRLFDGDSALSVRALLNVSWYYPPLVSYVSVPFYRIFGESEGTGYLVETFFLLVLVASVFFTGRKLFSSTAGLVAALLVSSFPVVIEYSRVFMLDLPLAAMVALCVLLLLESDSFHNVWFSLGAGAAFGLGELTKWTFFVFVAAPIAFAFIGAVRAREGRRHALLSLAGSALIAVVVAAPWYIVHIVQILTSRGGELARGNYTWLQSVLFYLSEIPGEVSLPGTALLVIALAGFFASGRKHGAYLGAWFLTSYVLLSLAGIKSPRFAIPLLVPIALAGGGGIDFLRSRFRPERPGMHRILTGACLFAAAQILLVLLVPAGSPTGRALSVRVLGTPALSVQGANGTSWDNTPALRSIVADMGRLHRTRAVVRVIPDHPYFNNSTAAYYALLHRLPLHITGTSGFPMFTDYVILKSADPAMDSPDQHRKELSDEIIRNAGSDTAAYRLTDSLSFPGGARVFIVKVQPANVSPAAAGKIVEAVKELSGRWVARYFRPFTGYSLDVGVYDSVQTAEGHIGAIHIRFTRGEFGDFSFNEHGIPVSDLDVEVRDILFDPGSALRNRSLLIFSIRSLSVNSICIASSDVMAYLSKMPAKDIQIRGIAMNNGILSADARIVRYDMPLELAIRLSPLGSRNIRFEFEHAQVGRVTLPAGLINLLTDAYNPVIRGLDVLDSVTLAPLTLDRDELRIGPGRTGP